MPFSSVKIIFTAIQCALTNIICVGKWSRNSTYTSKNKCIYLFKTALNEMKCLRLGTMQWLKKHTHNQCSDRWLEGTYQLENHNSWLAGVGLWCFCYRFHLHKHKEMGQIIGMFKCLASIFGFKFSHAHKHTYLYFSFFFFEKKAKCNSLKIEC